MATPTSALRGVEAAMVALVGADSTFVTRCPGGISSVEVESQTYPFVLLDKGDEQPWNTLGGATAGHGRSLVVRLHVYSRYKGDREALLILERLVELLDFAALTVTGFPTAMTEYVGCKVLIESRDKLETRHIPAEFLVRVKQ
jgi:hypothetical protein